MHSCRTARNQTPAVVGDDLILQSRLSRFPSPLLTRPALHHSSRCAPQAFLLEVSPSSHITRSMPSFSIPFILHPSPHFFYVDASDEAPIWLMPRAPFGTPVRKPCLNFLGTSLSERMRPDPVVFLRLAFSPQLTV